MFDWRKTRHWVLCVLMCVPDHGTDEGKWGRTPSILKYLLHLTFTLTLIIFYY
jgi:hypothetical protein